MPIKRSLIKEPIVLYIDWIDDTMNNSYDKKNTVLPIDTGIIIGIANINNWSNELRKSKVGGCNGN